MENIFYSAYSRVSSRSKIVLKNMFLSGFVKAGSILVAVLTVPITLKYLNQEEYGVWLTIYSIMTWLMYFDGGLGSGLRNRFTEAKAKNEEHKIRSYISTSYFILLCTIVILIPFFFTVNIWFNWAEFLNIKGKNSHDFNTIIFIIFTLFCLQFVFKLIDSILIADQRSGEADLLNMIGSTLSLVLFYFISTTSDGSLLLVGLVFCGIPLLVNLIYTIYLFLTRYKIYMPSHKFIDLGYYKDLMTLGSKFFIIQICSLITLGSTNIIITKVLGAADVVTYNLAFKYFSFVLLAFGILTSSMYSSFNEAYQRGDAIWIKNIIKKVRLVSILFLVVISLMLICSNFIYALWVGPSIKIPIGLSFLMAGYYGITIWVSVYATFISGIGRIKIAYYVSIINSIVYIPLAVLLAKYMGVEGVITAQILIIISGLYWLPVQYKKLINHEATGLWDK